MDISKKDVTCYYCLDGKITNELRIENDKLRMAMNELWRVLHEKDINRLPTEEWRHLNKLWAMRTIIKPFIDNTQEKDGDE